MGVRKLVNRALVATTGFQLQKPRPPAPPPKPKPKREFARDVDDEARDIIRAVRPWTMTSNEKLWALILAVRYVADHGVPGDVVECGVWRGGSMQAIALALAARGDTSRDLHLFDTFEGMPPPTEEDVLRRGRPAEELLAMRPQTHKVWAIADLDDVRSGMEQLDYPAERIHYHRGMVEETIPGAAPERIALLRLDTDWYASTRHELDHLYDRVPSGGVIVLDDYGYWDGARRAVDEFLERTGARLLLAPMGTGRIAVKP